MRIGGKGCKRREKIGAGGNWVYLIDIRGNLWYSYENILGGELMGKLTLPNKQNTPAKQITRRGIFEEGTDGLGRPYEKKLDDKGVFTKKLELKSGKTELKLQLPR